MAESLQPAGRIRFAVYEVDMHSCELRKHGRRLRLAGRPFQILTMLLKRPCRMISREEIRRRLWEPDTFVDYDHGMNSAIRKLRDALGDTAAKPRFIETLARRGYRFIASVEKEEAPAPAASTSTCAPVMPARTDWVGRVATVGAEDAANFLLLPVDEGVLGEKEKCEAATDDLGISLLVAAQKLLMVSSGTQVKILEAREPELGCRVRILQGQFIGETAFVPRRYFKDLE